ncbi:aldehyde dehydrogenase family protein [Lyngbya confervoides]|uniref:Aldehyde dehydrogenase family protein n=1 Tax=Lyngbya confervoides BDU141951 TaxID=1574623 RepID=A0ABD4T6G9_9CYAN|nr:aldehyde dehydrogenase family protein [Lyngbya confervoides]MCM1984332.1 aldehyde dehydrogenase family protein [Lyngbya confervoides BDU141951]
MRWFWIFGLKSNVIPHSIETLLFPMNKLFCRDLPLMSGYSTSTADHWRHYFLLDAEAKVKEPALLAQEIRLNRSTDPDPGPLPVAAQWPLVPDSELESIIQHQLQLAQGATQSFRAVPLAVRVELLRSYGRRLRENLEYWRQLTIQESYAYNAFLGSLEAILEIFQPSYLDMIQEWLSPTPRFGTAARIEHVPQGVFGVISPQNSSFPMLTQILHGAVLSANAVIVKPPHRLAIVALALVQDMNEFLQECGMPEGLISSLVYPNATTVMEHWLGLHGGPAKIDNLIFIGNSARREQILSLCHQGGIFNPIIELEGVDAAYVHHDLNAMDLQRAAQLIAHAKNLAAGQMCISLKRLYVHADIVDLFLHELAQAFQRYHPGSLLADDPYILGPSAWAAKLPQILENFESEGARVRWGGRRLNYWGQPDSQGGYIEPTLIDHVAPDSPLLKQEIFANILPIVRVTGNIDQVVNYINDCPFGIRTSIFAQDPQAIQTLTDTLRVGTLVINGNPLDCSIQIAGGRGQTTLDQNARIWPLDMSLRRVVTGGQNVHTLQEILHRSPPPRALISDPGGQPGSKPHASRQEQVV